MPIFLLCRSSKFRVVVMWRANAQGKVLIARTVSVKKSRLTGLKVKRSSQVNLRSVVMQVPCWLHDREVTGGGSAGQVCGNAANVTAVLERGVDLQAVAARLVQLHADCM